MKKNIFLKLKIALIASIMLLEAFIAPIDAATFTISDSNITLYVGDKTTVTVTANGVAGGPFSVSSSKSSIASVSGLNGEWLENNTGEITIKAKAEGTATITIKATVANLNDSGDEDTVTKKISVTVKKKTTTSNNNNNNNNTTTVTKSKDNNLASLSVSQGTLSPAFSAGTTEYSVNLDGDATKITLSAKANHTKATVSGTGEKSLQVGNNTFEIQCIAENGSVKTYKVNVYVDETPLIYTTYNDQKLGVVRNTTGLGIPATFEETTITLEGKEVTAYHSNQFNKTIVYLVDENNVKNFYIYEEGKGITSIFKPVSILGRNVYVVDLDETEKTRDDMTYQEIEIDKTKLMGWVYNNPEYADYSLIMVMNEFGEKVLYQHEKTENSLQLYLDYEEPVEEPVEEEPEELRLEYIFMATTAFFALATLIMFIVHQRFKKKSITAIKEYYQKRNQ